MTDEEKQKLPPEKQALWELLTRISDDPDPGVRRLGLLIYQLTIAEGRREVRLSYAQIEEDAGISPRQARPKAAYMQRQAMIERRALSGRPGATRGEPRGDLYRLALAETLEPEEEGAPTRAGPTKERLGDVTSASEPQGGLGSADKGAEPDNQLQI